MTALFGPFSVAATQIGLLGSAFTEFVNRLLAIEAALGPGSVLDTNVKENDPDGGVDAMIYGFPGTHWIPPGDSAWQFKRGDLSPADCREELRGAEWAQELLKSGASYCLVIGKMLTARKIANRKAALIAEAKALGLPHDPEIFRVHDANHLARWVELYPALAVSRVVGGPGHAASDFSSWSNSIRHNGKWIELSSRAAVAEQLAKSLSSDEVTDIRIEGVSGLGKTRLVMETLRTHPLCPLVTYIADEGRTSNEYYQHLLMHDRSAILVVDECDGKRHEKIAGSITVGSKVRLITIGPPGHSAIRGPVLTLTGASQTELSSILTAQLSSLPETAIRVIADYAGGNVSFALWIGEQLLSQPGLAPGDLANREAIAQFISTRLPTGEHFLAAAILALFTRIGWDGEVGGELELIASNFGIATDVFRATGIELEEAGLLTRQGRYRAVSPHPIAVFLARDGWTRYRQQIVQSLIPELTNSMAFNLFRRAADIGDFTPTRSALRQLISSDGPFASLQILADGRNSSLLTELAIIAPDEVCEHLSNLIRRAHPDELLQLPEIRRDLVWTLEKLAWHSRLFEDAADDLLLLALSENETWSNNATGVWSEMFGTMLPRTSAPPDRRSAYLQRIMRDARPEARLVAVWAAAKAFDPHEWTTVSGEIQGGVIVEPRGTPSTYGVAYEYQREVIQMLRASVEDADTRVADAAADVLIKAIHPVLESPAVLEAMKNALSTLPPEYLRRARIELSGLNTMFGSAEDRTSVSGRKEGLRSLYEVLPPAPPAEELEVLLHSHSWDFERGKLQEAIADSIRPVGNALRLSEVIAEPLPAAYEFGYAVASILGASDEYTRQFIDRTDINFEALIGYLTAQYDVGDHRVFRNLLESEIGLGLSAITRLAIAVRAPVPVRDTDFVFSKAMSLRASESTRLLMPGIFGIESEEMARIVEHWVSNLENQIDYNAVLQFLVVQLLGVESVPKRLAESLDLVVTQRSRFPDVGREAGSWAQLAAMLLPGHASNISKLIFDLVEADSVRIWGGHTDEASVLANAMALRPKQVWAILVGELSADSWRVQRSVQGWLMKSVPASLVEDWVGSSVERARLVSSIAEAGADRPTPVARYLLTRFGSDETVASHLANDFISGSWWGNHSDRLLGQIAQLEGWIHQKEPEGVRNWAREVITYLRALLESALEREEERD